MHYEASVAAKPSVLMNHLTVDKLNGRAPIGDAEIFGT